MKTNYFKIGLYIVGTIAVISIVYMILRAFSRGKKGIASIGDAIQDNRTDKVIANQTGISVNEINDARRIAKDVSVEMDTNKDLTGWTKAKNIVTDGAIMDVMNQVKSAGQLRAVSYVYQNEMTNNHVLKEDLKNELSNALFFKIPFIQNLN